MSEEAKTALDPAFRYVFRGKRNSVYRLTNEGAIRVRYKIDSKEEGTLEGGASIDVEAAILEARVDTEQTSLFIKYRRLSNCCDDHRKDSGGK